MEKFVADLHNKSMKYGMLNIHKLDVRTYCMCVCLYAHTVVSLCGHPYCIILLMQSVIL